MTGGVVTETKISKMASIHTRVVISNVEIFSLQIQELLNNPETFDVYDGLLRWDVWILGDFWGIVGLFYLSHQPSQS